MTNKELITHFYTSFKNKDYKAMQNCYADAAHFSDPVFTNLSSKEVKAMWEFLILKGKDLHIEFSEISADDNKGSAQWIATYTFSKTQRKVVNIIKAEFNFKDGKIIKHKDHFSFYNWSRQALGISGLLLGWTSFLKNKVRTQANQGLQNFVKEPTN